ncbi:MULTISPECIES: type II toxin-antitoxin system RatA family toxin [Streptomyces]|uniref:SRPBCC family protein n=1 Tax=Streptomyces doudnae TaxID=3075536 RepID=A0ABD5EUE7_9ACTN|nr:MULTISPECIES: SRPBCC family protein [unclassified Streptomyces]MDT0438261.1 SRPBCC family protein [Streptomyces sp. DSM 41981]MYQ67054.1 cyclase [Streptomyces sp. SID4950]SCE29298.1 Ribosome association toxin PasT (RatA) of the RatAB toxin-antitoxin module [Streptomyces sp. SolWspMP-5a-2]
MRHVLLEALVPGAKAEDVLHAVRRWERYPELAPHVQSTTVHATYPEPDCTSSWELHFRSGLLRWTERDEFLVDALEIRFEQTEGDFDTFRGTWSLVQHDDDVRVRFEADFDFGIPSLEGILDPIAERVVKETVAWAVAGMHPGTEILGGIAGPETARPGAATPA